MVANPDQILIMLQSINNKNKFQRNSSILEASTDTLIVQIINPIDWNLKKLNKLLFAMP